MLHCRAQHLNVLLVLLHLFLEFLVETLHTGEQLLIVRNLSIHVGVHAIDHLAIQCWRESSRERERGIEGGEQKEKELQEYSQNTKHR
jgi:hypothetical protein